MFGLTPSDRTLDNPGYAYLPARNSERDRGGFVRLGEKATEVLRRLEERPGFPGAQQHESGLVSCTISSLHNLRRHSGRDRENFVNWRIAVTE